MNKDLLFYSIKNNTAFNNFIEQDQYLSGRRGHYAERYAILSPWYSNWDVRIAQDVRVPGSENGDVLRTETLFVEILQLFCAQCVDGLRRGDFRNGGEGLS